VLVPGLGLATPRRRQSKVVQFQLKPAERGFIFRATGAKKSQPKMFETLLCPQITQSTQIICVDLRDLRAKDSERSFVNICGRRI